ncbi:Fatty acid synthase, partial [Trachymyrmex cornetzi]
LDYAEFSRRMGTVNNIEKFDADFFGLSFEQAHTLVPDARLLLEHSYEAIIDAGINPKQLQGKNTAVIIGSSYIETQRRFIFKDSQVKKDTYIGIICIYYIHYAKKLKDHLVHLKNR